MFVHNPDTVIICWYVVSTVETRALKGRKFHAPRPKSDPGFKDGFPDQSGYGRLPDRSQNVLGSFPCQRESFRQRQVYRNR